MIIVQHAISFSVGSLTIKIVVGDITEFQGDAIVNPANTYGYMSGGVALAIKMKGGKIIEDEAVRQAPIPIGDAVVTTGGSLKVKAVIHAPTVVEPGGRSSFDNVYSATRAALTRAIERGLTSIAFPLMGAGVGGLSPMESVKAMARAFKEFQDRRLEIHVYVRDPKVLEDVERALSEEIR